MQILTCNHGDSSDRTSKGICYNQHTVAQEITSNTDKILLESDIHPVSIKYKYFLEYQQKLFPLINPSCIWMALEGALRFCRFCWSVAWLMLDRFSGWA